MKFSLGSLKISSDKYSYINLNTCCFLIILNLISTPSLLFRISNSKIERVFSFKYLGLFLKPNLSWPLHITSICNKAKRVLGLIYRQFYKHCPPSTLMTLYKNLSLDPYLNTALLSGILLLTLPLLLSNLSNSLLLKLISKSWSSSYSTLLSTLKLPTLRHHRKKGKSL